MKANARTPRAWVPEENENRLAELRTAAGFTVPELARRAGTDYNQIRSVELCATGPYYLDGRVKPWVAAACRVLGKQVWDVFPREACFLSSSDLVDSQIAEITQRNEHPDIESKIEYKEILGKLAAISPRGARAVQLHSEGYTYCEIGTAFGCSVERARQIVAVGLRRLRGMRLHDR